MISGVEFILALPILPVFSIFKQQDNFVTVKSYSLYIRINLDINQFFPMIEQVFDKQGSTALDSHYFSAFLVYSFAVNLYLLSRWFDTVKVPLDYIPAVCTCNKQTLVFIDVNCCRDLRVSEYSDLLTLVHIDDPDLTIFSCKADKLLLESKQRPYGRDILNFFDETSSVMIPDSHLSVF